jgi:hypothetical protein
MEALNFIKRFGLYYFVFSIICTYISLFSCSCLCYGYDSTYEIILLMGLRGRDICSKHCLEYNKCWKYWYICQVNLKGKWRSWKERHTEKESVIFTSSRSLLGRGELRGALGHQSNTLRGQQHVFLIGWGF